jgi:hypothetical protein
MNRQSKWGHRRSIRWLKESRQREDGAEDLSTGWTDGRASAHPTTSRKLTVRLWSWSLQHRMNRWCVGWSVRWIVSTVMCGGRQQLEASDEPTVGKSIASDHPMVILSTGLAQQLVCFLGLFIPLSPHHLRLQSSMRHIQDHIQVIQVLICCLASIFWVWILIWFIAQEHPQS